MPITISSIYRYPVKGLSPEQLSQTTLSPGCCLPEDRRFAIALASTRFDPERPRWLPKRCFAMLMRDEKLARLDTRFDAGTCELTIVLSERSTLSRSAVHCSGTELPRS